MTGAPSRETRSTLLWLQSGGCGGCSMSWLGAESPDLLTALDAAGIDLLWHPSLSGPGDRSLADQVADIEDGRQRLDLLCIEGAVLRGPHGSGGFHRVFGGERTMMDVIGSLASRAGHVLAVGTCAAYGGVSAADGSETQACGLSYTHRRPGGLLGADFESRTGMPVVNVAGCPVHPGWVNETLSALAGGELAREGLDALRRPLAYTRHLVHHGCGRNEFYEYKASAESVGQLGCMMEHVGCVGTQAHADCNLRPWNGNGSCLDGNAPCIDCTAPDFQDPGHAFERTPKVAGIPVGLPTDMPKAWFVALASLSKAATPDRLRREAVATHSDVDAGRGNGTAP